MSWTEAKRHKKEDDDDETHNNIYYVFATLSFVVVASFPCTFALAHACILLLMRENCVLRFHVATRVMNDFTQFMFNIDHRRLGIHIIDESVYKILRIDSHVLQWSWMLMLMFRALSDDKCDWMSLYRSHVHQMHQWMSSSCTAHTLVMWRSDAQHQMIEDRSTTNSPQHHGLAK